MHDEPSPGKGPLRVGVLRYSTKYFGMRTDADVDAVLDRIADCLDHDLDVLMVPEFALTADRAITRDEADGITERLRELSEGHDTLVLPGSYIMQEEGYLYNLMPMVADGEVVGEYSKKYDGGELEWCYDYYGLPNGWDYNKEAEDYDGVVEHKGRRIGVELCMDYAEGALKDRAGIDDLDLQLVVACGISRTHHSATAVHDDGHVVICDGYKPYALVEQKHERKLWFDGYSKIKPVERVDGDLMVYELDA